MKLLPRFLRRREAAKHADLVVSGYGGLTPSMFAPLSDAAAKSRSATTNLNPLSQAWLDGLPRKVRPLQLAQRHPRLINQIALCWRDQRLTDRLLASLIVDQRGGRQGFAPPLLAELMILREYHGDRSAEEPDPIWADSTLATVDR